MDEAALGIYPVGGGWGKEEREGGGVGVKLLELCVHVLSCQCDIFRSNSCPSSMKLPYP